MLSWSATNFVSTSSAAPGEATGYGHDPSDAAEWKQIQKRVFTRWCNEQLKEDALEIEELSKDFCDGVRLVALIEALTEKKVGRYHKKPRMHAQRMENLEMALRLLAVEKIPLINIGKNTEYTQNIYRHAKMYIYIYNIIIVNQFIILHDFRRWGHINGQSQTNPGAHMETDSPLPDHEH